MDATLAGLIGTIIGAIATFLGSWYGAEKGAIRNARLQAKQAEYIATKELYNNLQMSVGVYKGLTEPGSSRDYVMFRKIIFDPEWTKQISQVNCLTNAENMRLLEWFSYFATIETNFSARKGPLSPDDIKAALNSDTSSLDKIIESLETWINNFDK